MSAQPFERAAIERYPNRASWDAVSIDLLTSVLDRWNLASGPVLTAGFAATVMAVTDVHGGAAVLKLALPHPEEITEAITLEAFPRGIAPRILRLDPWSWAMRFERIVPGDLLAQHPAPVEKSISIGCRLLAYVHASVDPPGIPALSDAVSDFIGTARARDHGHALERLRVRRMVDDAFDDAPTLFDGGAHDGGGHDDGGHDDEVRAVLVHSLAALQWPRQSST